MTMTDGVFDREKSLLFRRRVKESSRGKESTEMGKKRFIGVIQVLFPNKRHGNRGLNWCSGRKGGLNLLNQRKMVPGDALEVQLLEKTTRRKRHFPHIDGEKSS